MIVFKLWHFALRLLHGKSKRLLTSVLGAVFGVTLVVSMISLYINMNHSMDKQLMEEYGPVDLMVGYRDQEKRFNPDQIEMLRNISGIRAIGSTITNLDLYYHDSRPETARMLFIAVDNSPLTLSHYRIKQPIQPGDAVISASLASRLGVREGQSVKIPLPQQESKSYRIAQIIKDISHEARSEYVYLSISEVNRIYGSEIIANPVLVDLMPGANKEQIIDEIHYLITTDLDIEPMSGLDKQKENIRNLKWLSGLFGGLAFLTAGMFVLSNFLLSIRERYRDLAMLRAIGSSPRQLFFLIWTEAFLIGIISSALGSALGIISSSSLYGVANSWVGLNSYKFIIPWRAIIIATVAGWGYIMTIAAFPAWRASRIPPVVLVREASLNVHVSRRRLFAIPLWVGIPGLLILVFTQLSREGSDSSAYPLLSLTGGLLLVFGLFLGIGSWMSAISRLLEPVVKALISTSAAVSVRNIRSERRQSVVTVAVLAMAPLLFFSISVFLGSLQSGITDNLKKSFITDWRITHALGPGSDMRKEIGGKVENLQAADKVIPVSYVEIARLKDFDFTHADSAWSSAGRKEDPLYSLPQRELFSYKLVNLQDLVDLGKLPAAAGDMSSQIYISKTYAERLGIQAGERLTVTRNNRSTVLTVAAVVDQLPLIPDDSPNFVLGDWKQTVLIQPNDDQKGLTLESLMVHAKPGQSAALGEQLKAQFSANSFLRVSDLNSELKDLKRSMLQRIVLLYAVTAVVWVIGLLGGMTTLSANLLAKKREYAILRAISITPRQLTLIVLTQCILFCVISFTFGAGGGLMLSYSFTSALDANYTVNLTEILWMVLGAAVCFSITLLQPWLFSRGLGKESVTRALVNE